MKVRFKRLTIAGFKSYLKETQIDFGEQATIVEGRNGSGKSSIADAITWTLYGVDAMGSSLDPTNVFQQTDVTVKLVLVTDEGEHELGRGMKSGKNKFWINEAPVKATEYQTLVNKLFDKDEFLTLFNPQYFFSQHWTAQREQLLAFIQEPLNKDILERLPSRFADPLEKELKKLTLEKVEAKHRQLKKDTEVEMTKLRERFNTLKEMSEPEPTDNGYLQHELDGIMARLEGLTKERDHYEKELRIHNDLMNRARTLKKAIEDQAKLVRSIQEEDIQSVCAHCGQTFTEDAQQEAERHMLERLNKEKAYGKELVKSHRFLMEELKKHPEPKAPQDFRSLQERAMELREQIAKNQKPDYSKEIEKVQRTLQDVREQNIDSDTIVEAVKHFKAEKAHYMVQEVNNLFEDISVKLFEKLKNGEERTTFEIEWQGKPYSKLSTAERIRAGIELRNVYAELAGKDIPMVIDNFESISGAVKARGQVLTMAVKDKEMQIKKVGNEV